MIFDCRWTDGNLFANDELTIGDVKLTVPKSNKWDNYYCVFYDCMFSGSLKFNLFISGNINLLRKTFYFSYCLSKYA